MLFRTALVSLFLVTTAQAVTPYEVADLGTLPDGSWSDAYAINELSQIVGRDKDPEADLRAFLWQDGSMSDLGTLAGQFGCAYGINDRAQIVGQAPTAFLWQENVMTDLGTLGGESSRARGINNSGQVVGWADTSDTRHAFFWLPEPAHGLPAGMNDLGTFGGNRSHAYDINEFGEVVGDAEYAGSGIVHACLWSNGQALDLGTVGGPGGAAFAVNNRSEVVGYSLNANYEDRAFLWLPQPAYGLPAGMNDLGTLGGDLSKAFAINDLGQIVGNARIPKSGASAVQHAFIWQDGEMTDLNDLIPADSGWELQVARGINNRGQIVGYGYIGNEQHAFLLTPIPEPSVLALALLGLAGVAARATRRR